MITATAATNEDRHEVSHVTNIDQQGANNDVHVCVCVIFQNQIPHIQIIAAVLTVHTTQLN